MSTTPEAPPPAEPTSEASRAAEAERRNRGTLKAWEWLSAVTRSKHTRARLRKLADQIESLQMQALAEAGDLDKALRAVESEMVGEGLIVVHPDGRTGHVVWRGRSPLEDLQVVHLGGTCSVEAPGGPKVFPVERPDQEPFGGPVHLETLPGRVAVGTPVYWTPSGQLTVWDVEAKKWRIISAPIDDAEIVATAAVWDAEGNPLEDVKRLRERLNAGPDAPAVPLGHAVHRVAGGNIEKGDPVAYDPVQGKVVKLVLHHRDQRKLAIDPDLYRRFRDRVDQDRLVLESNSFVGPRFRIDQEISEGEVRFAVRIEWGGNELASYWGATPASAIGQYLDDGASLIPYAAAAKRADEPEEPYSSVPPAEEGWWAWKAKPEQTTAGLVWVDADLDGHRVAVNGPSSNRTVVDCDPAIAVAEWGGVWAKLRFPRSPKQPAAAPSKTPKLEEGGGS